MRKVPLLALMPLGCALLAPAVAAQDARPDASPTTAAQANPPQSQVGRTMADLIRALHDATVLQAQAAKQAKAAPRDKPANAGDEATDPERVAVQTTAATP